MWHKNIFGAENDPSSAVVRYLYYLFFLKPIKIVYTSYFLVKSKIFFADLFFKQGKIKIGKQVFAWWDIKIVETKATLCFGQAEKKYFDQNPSLQ